MKQKLGRTLIILLVVIGLTLTAGARFYTDLMWYISIGFQGVFLKLLLTRIILFLLVGVVTATFVALNLHKLRSVFRKRIVGTADNVRYFPADQPWLETLDNILQSRGVSRLLWGVSGAVGVLAGLGAFPAALSALMFLNSQNTGILDPVFQRDVSFYMFRLPIYVTTISSAFALGTMLLLGIGALYFLSGNISLRRQSNPAAVGHLSLLVAFLLVVRGAGYLLDSLQLVFSPRGVAFGASYTDMAASRPILFVLMGLSVVGALFALANLRGNKVKNLVMIPAVIVVISVLGGSIYPSLFQQFVVEPNELARETPYISYNINFTRMGYGLDRMQVIDLPAPRPLTRETVEQASPTLDNVRILDWRPLLQTYSQLQSIRLYYRFNDVDIDRYNVDGVYQQVMIAARELSIQDLPAAGRTWINEHLRYTHGYGAVVSPVTRISPRGEPIFLVQDIPPRSVADSLKITRPEIYFGEFPGNYVIINAKADEFSYPLGEENATTRYEGDDGVKLGFLNKLMFSIRYGTTKMILSDDVTADSRILFNRNILERLRLIAPFLSYEEDPYLVIEDGRLFWIVDAYTTSRQFPFSQPLSDGSINYIRNSVKVTVDAYNGTVTYYVMDEEDPVVGAMARAFPDLFTPFAEMPDGLKAHIRYPEQLLNIQANMLSTYHMTSPSTFYNKEDVWRIAQEQYAGRQQPVDPYYMIMEPPAISLGQEEFMLVLPMTPAGTQQNQRHNMVAYMAARNDYPNYGELILYRFPKDTLTQGPMQVESRIDQDEEISRNITLWSSAGSNVFRGNLLVIPLGDSLIYVEPLYIQSTGNSLPELKKVIIATADRLVWGDNFELALAQLIGVAPPPPAGDRPPIGDTDDFDIAELVQSLEETFAATQAASQAGNWAEYGRLLLELEQIINRLAALNAGSVTPID